MSRVCGLPDCLAHSWVLYVAPARWPLGWFGLTREVYRCSMHADVLPRPAHRWRPKHV